MKRRIIMERIPGPMASIYEKATKMVIGSYYSQVAQEIASSLKSGLILDLGTGPGYLPIEIVKRASSIKVDGVDLTPELIKIAQKNAVKANLADRLHFEVGNATKLRFEDNSYDMVISTGMLHSLRDPVKVLKECYRVLKPGGEAWIYDPAQVSSQIDMREWRASLTYWERFLYRLFTLYPLINPPHFYTRKQAIEMLATTKFKEYQSEEGDNEIKIKLRK